VFDLGALFAAQTAILLSALATDFWLIFQIIFSGHAGGQKRRLFFFYIVFGLYSVALLREAVIDLFIMCCIKSK
jgi:hypothetical protein